MTREEIEKYGEMLDNGLNREFWGIIKEGGGCYMISEGDFLIYTGRLGAIRYIKELEEMLQKNAEELYNKTKEE